jgi:copper chaperone CopZ
MEDEQVANTIVLLIILMLCIFGIRGTARRMASGCCAGTDSIKRIRVKDRNKKHYPYQALVTIEGMHCENCAARVENALNEMDGIWAEVSLNNNSAQIRMKEELDQEQLAAPICAAGYSAHNIRFIPVSHGRRTEHEYCDGGRK